MKRHTKRTAKAITMAQWLDRVQDLIAKHSTAPRTRGKYKGHSTTNAVAWASELAAECNRYIARRNKGKSYDENMALASLFGMILCAWYAQVHRAKGMDPNRPIARRVVFKKLAEWRAKLAVATTDERLMVAVFRGQQWNLPFGRGARGGKFV